jgi:16S rRNA (guanine966-N2)-methyltransferase
MRNKRVRHIRVIAGEYGGRRLVYPSGRILRPTMDRIREALFSAIQKRVCGARFADLFCAAGGVGIEALSRGASAVDFVEQDSQALECLGQNLAACGVGDDRYLVHPSDVFVYLEQGSLRDSAVNIVFADPPYGGDFAGRLLAHFHEESYADLQLFILEHRRGVDTPTLGLLEFSKTRRFGDTFLSFWNRSQ